MTERKRFKFQSSSKVAKSIILSAYDDIISFSARDNDGPRKCFKITLANLLRVKDLLKFQNDLRELQKSKLFTNDFVLNELDGSSFEYFEKSLEVLLNCSKRASPVELDYLCRLLAAYFKDFGNIGILKFPFDDLMEIIESNANLNSKPIFTLILTYFKVHTSYILEHVHTVLKDFLPWLSSRNPLIKRLSMESLGSLLRRAPISIIKDIIRFIIHTDGAEKVIFSIIQNIDGNFTSKVQSVFILLFEDLIPNGGEDLCKIAQNVRNTIRVMSSHTKDNKIDLSWLKNSYENNLKRLSQDYSKIDFKATCVVLELNLEMFMTLDENKFTSVKNYPLITENNHFEIMFTNFIIPLFKFSNQAGKGYLFEDLCSYLLRVVRSGAESVEFLDREFSEILTNIDHNSVGMTNINSFLSLFEWRLKTDDLTQVSYILLVLARILTNQDIFHPLIVNKSILDRVLLCIEMLLSDLESRPKLDTDSCSGLESESRLVDEQKYLDLFGIIYGLICINKVRIKLKAGKLENKDNESMFERVLVQVLKGIEQGHDSRVLLRIYTLVLEIMSENVDEKIKWVEKLVSIARHKRQELFSNYFLVELLVNYKYTDGSVVTRVVESLPNENELLRVNAIKLVQEYYDNKNDQVYKEYLSELVEIELLPNDVESSRKKCMMMSRVINMIDFEGIRNRNCNENKEINIKENKEENTNKEKEEEEIEKEKNQKTEMINGNCNLFINLVKRVLLSQYFVKFSPLWEGAYNANVAFIHKLKGFEKSLQATWELYFDNIKNLDSGPEPKYTNQIVELALNYKTREKTDLVTIQFHLLRVVFEIISNVKDRDDKVEQLVQYTLDQFKNNTDYLRNSIVTLSSVFTKFSKSNYRDELFNCCVTLGIKSSDPKVRESSLVIISKRHKIDQKRLGEMCVGNLQQISSVISTYPYGKLQYEGQEGIENSNNMEDQKLKDLSIGIEIRLLVPRIYQHSNVSHGNNVIDYFLNFEPKYVSLMFVELLPNKYSEFFISEITNNSRDEENENKKNRGNNEEKTEKQEKKKENKENKKQEREDESFKWMFNAMKFNETTYSLHLPNVLTTVNLVVRRLVNHLKPQAVAIMELCCSLLQEYSESEVVASDCNIIVERSFKIMMELVRIFEVGYFVDVLVKYSEVIVRLTGTVGLDFVLLCTSQMEYIERFCTKVIFGMFPGVFEGKLTQKQITLANNMYNHYPKYVKQIEKTKEKEIWIENQEKDNENKKENENTEKQEKKKIDIENKEKMMVILIEAAETLLDSMSKYRSYDCDLISCVVCLELRDEVKQKALDILLLSLPSRSSMNKSVNLNVKNEIELWKKILNSLNSCVYLLKNEEIEHINMIWDFVDNVLSLVSDNGCRKLASTLLTKMPSNDEGIIYTGGRLCSVNGVSVELRLDLDLNVEVISEIVEDLERRELSLRCINTLVCHSLFLLWNHNSDPGVRRCVLRLLFRVLEITKNRLEKNPGSSEINEDQKYVVGNTIVPFIRRCLGGKAEDHLVCLCLEFLEQFVLVFSCIPDFQNEFSKLHGDLIGNVSVAECFHKMRELQKYKRCKGLKQLQLMVESGCFTNTTLLKLIIPICLQFLIQRNAVRHLGLSDMSKQCLIASCSLLPVPSFIKLLKKLLLTYTSCKLPIVLSVFASTTKEKMESLISHNSFDDNESFQDKLGVGVILGRLKKMSLVQGKRKVGDVPVVEVFESLGYLLQYYPESIVNRELVKQCRILSKFLASRNRDVRRLARISLINLAKPFGTKYIDVFIKELFTNMTKGYKCSVLIFTIYAILNKVLDEKNYLNINNQLKYLYNMILDEISRMQEKDDSRSKIDEARHPKSSQLISLITQYATSGVVESNFSFLWALLNGKLVSNKTHLLEYSDKFLRKSNELIVSATSGLIMNKNVDSISMCFKIFMTFLPNVRAIERNIRQFPREVVEDYAKYTEMPEFVLKDSVEISKPETRPVEDENRNNNQNNKTINGNISYANKLKDRYTIMPGASTGRSFESSLKKPGFENHIFAPLFVNSCIRLFSNIVANMGVNLSVNIDMNNSDQITDMDTDTKCNTSGSEEVELTNNTNTHSLTNGAIYGEISNKKKYQLCEFSVLVSFLSEEVMLQKSGCSCLLKLCKLRPALIEDFGVVLASNLVDRMGSLDLVGSEELAKDHIGLISLFFKNKYLDILHEAWDRSNRKGKMVDCLLLQIETNLNRPKLHTSLLKLLLVLIQSTVRTNSYTVNSTNMNNMLTNGTNKINMLNGYEDKPEEKKNKENGHLKSPDDEQALLNGNDKGDSGNLSVYFEKEFYTVTYQIMIRMLKGNISTRSISVVSRVVGYSFILLPMDENTRAKRFALLLKHVNSEDPQVRLVTIRTLLVIMTELPGQMVWKRYASLVVLAVLPQLVSEDDPACRKFLQMLVTHIWTSGNKDNKNELLDVVAHFVRKMKKHVHLAISFFIFLTLKNENSLHNFNRLNLKVLSSFIEEINDDHWQNCYYWLMLLEHMFSLDFDLTKEPASRIWEFVLDSGLSSKHPWVLSSSLRTFSKVLLTKKLHTLIPNLNTRFFTLLNSSFRNLSTYFGSIERHKKLELAVYAVFVSCIDLIANSSFGVKEKCLERLTSKLCYVLRCDLGRKAECKQRINVLLDIFSHLVTKEVLYGPKQRVTLLKIMIAVFRVAHTKPAGISHRKTKFMKEIDTSQAEKASGILDKIENQFNISDGDGKNKNSPAEFLKLLSFARNFVLKSRLVKKKQIALSMVTNTKLAALKKLRKNKLKRRKIRN